MYFLLVCFSLRGHFLRLLAIRCLFSSILFLSSVLLYAQDGQALFQKNCASCHAINRDLTGPALQGTRDRVTDKELLYGWIRNSKKVLAEGDPYFSELYEKWNRVAMSSFPSLKDEEIESILDYIDAKSAELAKKSAATSSGSGQDGTSANPKEDKDSDVTLYLVILIVLLFIAYLFKTINANLTRVIAEKKNETIEPSSPFYRDKRYWILLFIVAFVSMGVFIANRGMTLGIQQNYQPEQPIFFSHRVHAGINQIDCQYCHSTVENSKHALIPSINVCMNCHQAITEYSGVALYNEEGEAIDGTAEIKKLHKYANFEPGKPWSAEDGNEVIIWYRVHNLPDHVKFNHSQHVSIGQLECQTCHGQVQEMDEVYQYSTLAMGWCVNCHRQTEVQFANNDFYKMYKRLHQDLADGTIDRVTVEDIGGTECQKCHY